MYDHTFTSKSPDQPSGHTFKWAVSLLNAYDNFYLPQGLFGYVWVNMITLSLLSVLVTYSNHIIQVYSQFKPLKCHFLLLRQVPITS